MIEDLQSIQVNLPITKVEYMGVTDIAEEVY